VTPGKNILGSSNVQVFREKLVRFKAVPVSRRQDSQSPSRTRLTMLTRSLDDCTLRMALHHMPLRARERKTTLDDKTLGVFNKIYYSNDQSTTSLSMVHRLQ
jgi:hypothetical protein